MTSLQRQLQRLAVPGVGDTQKSSLLFKPDEAATQDIEEAYQLGFSGLEQLIQLDRTSFVGYLSSLFHETSKTYNRHLQDAEGIKKLDARINEFLIRLSPRIPYDCAKKALEWLIRRYQIDHHNAESLLWCVLPYHNMEIFKRIIVLLKPWLKSPGNKWIWLLPSAEAEIPVITKVISQQCRSNTGFFRVLCKRVPESMKVLGTESKLVDDVIRFYYQVVVGMMVEGEAVPVKILGNILTEVMEGLRSKNHVYQRCSYMILAEMCERSCTPIKEDNVKTIVTKLIKKVLPDNTQMALRCLLVIYNTQGLTTFSNENMKNLLHLPAMLTAITKLRTNYNTSAFLRALIMSIIKQIKADLTNEEADEEEGGVNYTETLLTLLGEVKMEIQLKDEIVLAIVTALVEVHSETKDGADNATYQKWCATSSTLLQSLQIRLQASLASALQKVHSAAIAERNADKKSSVEELTQIAALPSQYSVVKVGESEGSVLLYSIHHVEASIRCIATTKLVASLRSGEGTHDAAFVTESLSSRLQDEDSAVVDAVLELKEDLAKYIGSEEGTATLLLQLIHKNMHSKAWSNTVRSAVHALSPVLSSVPVLSSQLLPLLLDPCPLSGEFRQSALPGTHPLCPSGCADNWEVVNACAKILTKAKGEKAEHMMNDLVKNVYASSPSSRSFVLLVLSSVMERKPSLPVASTLLTLLCNIEEKDEHKVGVATVADDAALMAGCIAAMKEGLTADTLALWAADKVLDYLVKHPVADSAGRWIASSDPLVQAGLQFLNLIWKRTTQKSASPLIDGWMQLIKTKFTQGELVLYIAPSVINTGDETAAFLMCKAILKYFSQNDADSLIIQLNKFPYVLVSLVQCLSSPVKAVRHWASRCCNDLSDKCKGSSYVHRLLLESLGARQEELAADRSYITKTIAKHYNKTEKKAYKQDAKAGSLNAMVGLISDESLDEGAMEALLSLFVKVQSHLTVSAFSDLARRLLARDAQDFTTASLLAIDHILKVAVSETSAPALTPTSAELKLFSCACDSLQCVVDAPGTDDAAYGSSVRSRALERVTREVYELCVPEVQKRLISKVLDAGNNNNEADVESGIKRALKEIKFTGEEILHEIEQVGKNGPDLSIALDRLRPLLEVTQTRKKIKAINKLVPALLALLDKMHLGEVKDEYLVQLILSALENMVEKWTPEKEEIVHVEVLNNYVNNSCSVITQKQALMVIAGIAPHFPNYVLHNVMALFKFVSKSKMYMQEDDYSVRVITTTIGAVIPAVIQAHKTQPGNSNASLQKQIVEIIEIFVSGQAGMITARAISLLGQLLQVVGVREYLWVMMVLIINHRIRIDKSSSDSDDGGGDDHDHSGRESDLERILLVCGGMAPEDQLHSHKMLLHYLTRLLSGPEIVEMINVSESEKSMLETLIPKGRIQESILRSVLYRCSRLCASFLSSHGFTHAVTTQQPMGKPLKAEFQHFMKALIIYWVIFLKGEYGSNTSNYSKIVQKAINSMLDRVNGLLPSTLYLESINLLFRNKTFSVQKKALELVLDRMKVVKGIDETLNEHYKLLPELLEAATRKQPKGVPEQDWLKSRQLALAGIQSIAKHMAKLMPKMFLQYLEQVLDMCAKEKNSVILSLTLMCIGELASNIGDHAITLMPKLIAILKTIPPKIRKQQMEQGPKENLLFTLRCWLKCVKRVCEDKSLAYQLRSDIILPLCTLDLQKEDKALWDEWKSVVSFVASEVVELSIFLRQCDDVYRHIYITAPERIQSLMLFVEEHMRHASKFDEDFLTYTPDITKILFTAMDFRSSVIADEVSVSAEIVEQVEESVLSAVQFFFIRIPQDGCHQLLQHLLAWTLKEEEKMNTRKLTFFHLLNNLSHTAKAIFNQFVPPVLASMTEALDACNKSKPKEQRLAKGETRTAILHQLLSCLLHCLTCDRDRTLVTEETFGVLMQPLVEQLENVDSEYVQRSNDLLVPAISQFGVSCGNEDLHLRSLVEAVSQIATSTGQKTKVKLSCLSVLEQMAEKLGDGFAPIIPEVTETAQYLLEDTNNDVVFGAEKVVTLMEQISPPMEEES